MMRVSTIRHRFVDAIPSTIKDGVLYVSTEYATAAHKCCCGCGQEVVTPLGPTDWRITVHGDAVTLYPSVGNWSFPCRSHYWIERGRIVWAEGWSKAQIDYGRNRDRFAKQRLYGELPDSGASQQQPAPETGTGFWAWLWRLITGR